MDDHHPYPLDHAELDGVSVQAVAWVEQEYADGVAGLKRLVGVATGKAVSGTIEGVQGTVEYSGDIVEGGRRRTGKVTVTLTSIEHGADGLARAELRGTGEIEYEA